MTVERRFSVKWGGREVEQPVARAAVAALAVCGAVLAVLFALFAVVVLSPLCLVLHPLFRLAGRRGTVRRDGDVLTITLDREAFRRAN